MTKKTEKYKEIEKCKKKAERSGFMPVIKIIARIADNLLAGKIGFTDFVTYCDEINKYTQEVNKVRLSTFLECLIKKIQENENLNWKEVEYFINSDNSFFFKDIIHTAINSHSDKIKCALAIIYAKYYASDKNYKYVRMFHSITKITDIDFDVFLEIGDTEKNKRFYYNNEIDHWYNKEFFENNSVFQGENILRHNFYKDENFSKQIISDYNLGDIGHLYTILHQLIHANLLLYHGGVQGLSGGYSLGGFCFNQYSSEIYKICKEASDMNELRKTKPVPWYENIMAFMKKSESVQ